MDNKPAIPKVPPADDKAREKFDRNVKERLEIIAGERGKKIEPLPAGATLAETSAKLNELLALLQ